uniref:Transposase n=1 Tax=Haemonchus contortus TaxID=6289 RepID=A0A7I4YZ22_HAECO
MAAPPASINALGTFALRKQNEHAFSVIQRVMERNAVAYAEKSKIMLVGHSMQYRDESWTRLEPSRSRTIPGDSLSDW